MADSNAVSTTAAATIESTQDDKAAMERQRVIAQAHDEAHDADIPSSIGYILDEPEDEKRRQSLAEQKRNSLTRKRSLTGSHDVEKEGHDAADQEDPTATSSGDDANVVFWDGPDDAANPYNWPTWRKVVNCVIISALTFVTPLGSSIFAPGVPQLMMEFQSSSNELAAFVVSVYVLGFAFGPMLMAPLSEIYGRLWIYHICNIGFLAFLGLQPPSSLSCSHELTLCSRLCFGPFPQCAHCMPVLLWRLWRSTLIKRRRDDK